MALSMLQAASQTVRIVIRTAATRTGFELLVLAGTSDVLALLGR